MNFTLKNNDTLYITLPNGNKVEIESHNDISRIEIRNKTTFGGRIENISITNYGNFNSIYTWIKGGLKKVSKSTKKEWFEIGNDIPLFKN